MPCVSCLVIGMTPADLASPPAAGAGVARRSAAARAGTPRGDKIVDFMQTLAVTGATVGVLIAPSTGASIQQIVFEARTTITALRAENAGPAGCARWRCIRGIAASRSTSLRPYVDAVVRAPEGPRRSWPGRPKLDPFAASVDVATVDDLVAASLTPGGERVLLPVDSHRLARACRSSRRAGPRSWR